RLSRVRPLVEAVPALPPELPDGDHLLEYPRRPVVLCAELLVQVARDVEPHVEADQVRQPQRTHRVTVAELERLVDVCGARHTFLHHAHRLETEQHAESRCRKVW